jgi:hypothetical protein
VGALGAERRVVAVAGVDPRLVRQRPEQPLLDVVDQAGEPLRVLLGVADAAGEPRGAPRAILRRASWVSLSPLAASTLFVQRIKRSLLQLDAVS